MSTETMFAGINLDDLLIDVSTANDKRSAEINNSLSEIDKRSAEIRTLVRQIDNDNHRFSHENVIREELTTEQESLDHKRQSLEHELFVINKFPYKEIDPSFLSMNNFISHRGRKISVPKFSINKINISKYKEGNYISLFCVQYRKGILDPNPEISIHERIDEVLELEIVKGSDFYRDSKSKVIEKDPKKYYTYKIKGIPLLKSFVCPFYINILSGFTDLIPSEVKEKIHAAYEPFDSAIYLITETKPEEWNMFYRLVKDPLIIGVSNKKCYLISKFDTTPMERYASIEFTTD